MRNSIIVDIDGANEVQEVFLTPKTGEYPSAPRFLPTDEDTDHHSRAKLCQEKVDALLEKKPYSTDQLVAELNRLRRFKIALTALQEVCIVPKNPIALSTGTNVALRALQELKKAPPTYPKADPGFEPKLDDASTALTQAYSALYAAQGKLNSLMASGTADKGTMNTAQQAVGDARTGVTNAINKWESVSADHVKWQLSQPGSVDLGTMINNVDDQIGKLQELHKGKAAEGIVPIVGAHSSGDDPKKTSSDDMASPGMELANPVFGVAPTAGGESPLHEGSADPWTKIQLSFSATDLKTKLD